MHVVILAEFATASGGSDLVAAAARKAGLKALFVGAGPPEGCIARAARCRGDGMAAAGRGVVDPPSAGQGRGRPLPLVRDGAPHSLRSPRGRLAGRGVGPLGSGGKSPPRRDRVRRPTGGDRPGRGLRSPAGRGEGRRHGPRRQSGIREGAQGPGHPCPASPRSLCRLGRRLSCCDAPSTSFGGAFRRSGPPRIGLYSRRILIFVAGQACNSVYCLRNRGGVHQGIEHRRTPHGARMQSQAEAIRGLPLDPSGQAPRELC